MTIQTVEQTRQVLSNHIQAFGRGDIEAIMADYAPNAVFLTPDGPLYGQAEVRALFETLLKDFPPGSSSEILQQIVEGELAHVVWSGESDRLKVSFAVDTLIVRNGKIQQQTFAAQIEPKY